MNATVLTVTLATLFAADPSPDLDRPPKPNPYAPSLPYLTREEEDRLDQVIDRFIQYDTGRLRGAEGRDALHEFEQLKPEAIPALIRGLNRAARIEHSCPAVVIAGKLRRLLMASDDARLLEFARDEIGADVGRTRHAAVLNDLRVRCMFRRNTLARLPTPAPAFAPAPATTASRPRTTAQLVEAASTERGPRLRQVLLELEQRRGREVLDGLTVAAASYDRDTRQFGRDLLDRHLARLPAAAVRERLADKQAEVRKAAARVVAARFPALAGALIALLDDEQAEVRAEARRALVRLAHGEDFGPAADATPAQREQALERWRDWWVRSRR